MEWVSWVLFESVRALGGVLFTANFVLLVYWRRTRRVRPLLAGLAAAVLLLVLQALVVTRRERAERILDGIESDVVEGRIEALAAALAPGFQAGRMGREEFLPYVERQFEKVRVRSLHRSELRVRESEPDQFVVGVAYQGDVTAEDFRGLVRTRWQITFVRNEAGWQISAVRPTFIDGIPNPDWDQIGRY